MKRRVGVVRRGHIRDRRDLPTPHTPARAIDPTIKTFTSCAGGADVVIQVGDVRVLAVAPHLQKKSVVVVVVVARVDRLSMLG
jgi:regulator of RNase E activity RraA